MNSIEIPLSRTEDVFAFRHAGRAAAVAIGLDEADQVRLATALSELGRQALSQSTSANAGFSLEPDGALTVTIEGLARSSPDLTAAVDAARRLVTDLTAIESNEADVSTVRLTKRPPRGFWPAPEAVETAIRASLSSGPLEELRLQNHDLISALEDLRAGQEELLRVNQELEETNRGVLAMYAQLSDELEETNRGVVALYAELDGKSMQLKEVSDSKSRFLASISHELRSPINSIVGLVRLLQDEMRDPLDADRGTQLGYIDEAASRLLQLVDELLDLAKAESGRLQPLIAEIDLSSVFAELRGAIRPLVAPDVELIVDPPHIEAIYTDHSLLIQVLRNLMSNAAKFTETGRIELHAAKGAAGEIIITVADSGIGIPADQQQKVFEDFYQVRGPLQKLHKGTGLGLAYSRKVARALGGDISLRSTPGVGSEFVLSLPNARPGSRLDDGVESDARLGTVLVVDDDPAFRMTLRSHLGGFCHRIVEAEGGRQALDAIKLDIPDAIFLDLSMPDMTGEEVIAALGRDLRYRRVPIVVVTSGEPATSGPVPGAMVTILKSELTRESVAVAVTSVARVKATMP